MLTGLLFGLVSAGANGTANVLGGIAARRAGVLTAPFMVLTIALVFMTGFAVAAQLRFDFGLSDLPLLLLLGGLVGLGYTLLYRALELGPVSIISPITATSGAASVLFAVTLLGERPSALQWTAVPISAVGAVFVTLARHHPETGRSGIGMGPIYAALTVLTAGASNALIRIPIVQHGAVQAVVVQRFFTVAFVALFIVIARRGRYRAPADGVGASQTVLPQPRGSGRQATAALLMTMGAIDGIGFIAFGLGLSVAPAWLLGIVSQSGRLAAAFVALFVFHESLRAIQWIGVGLVAVGLVLAVW